MELVGLEQDLSDKPGIKVDLVTDRSMHPKLKSCTDKEIKVILE